MGYRCNWTIAQDSQREVPRTARGKCYMLTAVDYLSKWAEVKPIKKVDSKKLLILYMSIYATDLAYHWSYYQIMVLDFEGK